jgi:glycosyltransferase involved in cell wall biosynthesis
MNEAIDVTFFVPCLDEEENSTQTIGKIDRACAGTGASYEIIIVDDGSTDRTAERVRAHIAARTDDRVRLHVNGKNLGLGHSFWFTATLARGRKYTVVGGDNELPEDCIRSLVESRDRADIVIAMPILTRNRPFVRRAFSRTYIALFNALSGHGLRCVNTPFMLPTEFVISYRQRTDNFGYFAELLCDLLCDGKSLHQVPVSTIYRNTGKTSALKAKNFLAVAGSFVRIGARRFGWRGIRPV